jgi:hypothetical protein
METRGMMVVQLVWVVMMVVQLVRLLLLMVVCGVEIRRVRRRRWLQRQRPPPTVVRE